MWKQTKGTSLGLDPGKAIFYILWLDLERKKDERSDFKLQSYSFADEDQRMWIYVR